MKHLEKIKNLTEIQKYNLIVLLNELKQIEYIKINTNNTISYKEKVVNNENFNFCILNFENNILKLSFKNKDIDLQKLKFIEIKNLAKNYFKSLEFKILNQHTYLKIKI